MIGVILLFGCVAQFGFMFGVCHSSVGYSSASESCEALGLVVMLVVLGLLGGCHPVFPYVELSGSLSAGYFWLFVQM